MNNIDFELYRIFYVVAKCGKISEAAESLYISQPAVSQQIQKLEYEIGGKLFYRTPKGVVLTEEGKKLYDYIKNDIERLDNASNKFIQYAHLEEGRIRVKCGSTIGKIILYKALAKYIKDFPKIEIEMSSGRTSDSLEELSNGKIDLVMLTFPDDYSNENLKIVKLKEADICFYSSKNYLASVNKEIKTYCDLNDCTLLLPKKGSNLSKVIDDFFEKNEINLKNKYEISSTNARNELTKNDVGICCGYKDVVKEELEKGDLIEVKIEPSLPKVKLGLAMLKEDISSFAATKFFEYIEKECN